MRPPVPSESNLAYGCERISIPQPTPRIRLTGSPGEWGEPPAYLQKKLDGLHLESTAHFLEPYRFGYIKDRRHVAGFESHRFGQIPDSPKELNLRTLDLVGLLLHDEPRVYVSENLPRMDELRDAPTRPLDQFESVALASLQGGDDQWIISEGENIRMVGAIRNTKQCIACHGGKRGDLLGAFSYTLAAGENPLAPAAGR
jgi:hypothetical protein